MKKLTCKDLGGSCQVEIVGNSFEEIGQKSHAHVMDQVTKGDEAHKASVERMRDLSPEAQQAMMAELERKFNEAQEV